MNDKSNISPKAWELLNNLTASIHRHVENHNSADYAQKARAEDALVDYIVELEAEVAKKKESKSKISDSISETNEDFIHTKFGYCYFEMEFGKNPIVFNLYVHPEYRKTGQAKKLLQYVINEIRQTGYSGVIDIEATPREQSIDREKLSDFYSGMGLHVLEDGLTSN